MKHVLDMPTDRIWEKLAEILRDHLPAFGLALFPIVALYGWGWLGTALYPTVVEYFPLLAMSP